MWDYRHLRYPSDCSVYFRESNPGPYIYGANSVFPALRGFYFNLISGLKIHPRTSHFKSYHRLLFLVPVSPCFLLLSTTFIETQPKDSQMLVPSSRVHWDPIFCISLSFPDNSSYPRNQERYWWFFFLMTICFIYPLLLLSWVLKLNLYLSNAALKNFQWLLEW